MLIQTDLTDGKLFQLMPTKIFNKVVFLRLSALFHSSSAFAKRIHVLITKLVPSRWLGTLFFAFLWAEAKSRSMIKTRKNERGHYPAIFTEQAWSIKDLLYGQKIATNNFALTVTKR